MDDVTLAPIVLAWLIGIGVLVGLWFGKRYGYDTGRDDGYRDGARDVETRHQKEVPSGS